MRKRNLFVISAISSLILLSSCSNNENSIPEETTAPIYVDRDELEYAEGDGTNEQLRPDATDSSSNESTMQPVIDQDSSESSPPSTTTSKPGTTTPAPDNNPLDDIYSVAEDQVLEKTDISLGKMKIACYDNQSENGMSGLSTVITFGDQPYGYYRDNLFPHNGAQYIDQPYTLDIEQNGLSFKFDGAGHYIRKAGEENGAQLWLELENDGSIVPNERVGSIQAADGYDVNLKGIAVRLGEFERVYSNGYAKYKPTVPVTFLTDKVDIEVGMPFQLVTAALGEGTVIAVQNEENQTEEYHIFKTNDFTLILEKAEYPDIKPSMQPDEESAAPKETILVQTVILIKDEITASINTEEV